MIRKAKREDISRIMEIWLDTNLKTHDFIAAEYWQRNYELVESMMHDAQIYIYEKKGIICGFAGVMEDYIAGLFVARAFQSKGIGKALLDYLKMQREEWMLHVYKKNEGAVKFYLREGFVKEREQMENENQEIEYEMRWQSPIGNRLQKT